MKTFREFLNEANEITLYSAIKDDNTFKDAKEYMDKEGWNINKITLAKKLIDADASKGKKLVKKYLD